MALVRVRANCAVFGLEALDEADADNSGEIALLITAGLLTNLGTPSGNAVAVLAADHYAQNELLAPSAFGEPQ